LDAFHCSHCNSCKCSSTDMEEGIMTGDISANVGRLSLSPCFGCVRSACCARAATGHAGATLAKDQRGGSGTKGVRYAHFTDQ
jgi:hypothetical protein